MYLTIFDLVLLLILFIFISFGFFFGLIQTIGALIGVIFGAWLAGIYYDPFGQWLSQYLLGSTALANIVAFILIFTLVNRAVGLIFHILNKIFNFISIIPFSKAVNRLLGALLGFLEGILVLGLILYFVSRFVTSEWFIGVLTGSKVAIWLTKMASILAPLLSESIKALHSVI